MTGAPAKRVLFFAPFGSHSVHNQLDAVLAAALKQRGCEVAAVLCNGIFPDCHVTIWSQDKKGDCAHCAMKGRELFKAFGVPTIQLSEYLADFDSRIAREWVERLSPEEYSTAMYEGVPIGDWTTPTVHSRFRVNSRDLSKPEIRKVHKQYLVDALTTYFAVMRIYQVFQPTHVSLFSAWLTQYRVAYEVARMRGINTLAHEKGTNMDLPGGSFRIEDNCVTGLVQSRLDIGRAWQQAPMNATELAEVKNFFTDLEQTGGSGYYDFKSDFTQVRARLRIPAEAKVIGIFTSSDYELTTHPDYKDAPDQLEFIDYLMEALAGSEYYLVVRHHPNIGKAINTAETEFLTRAYLQALRAPANVRIIMPNEELTSYALLPNIDIAISAYSTVAIEAPARGIPSAMFDMCPYHIALRHRIPKNFKDGAVRELLAGLTQQIEDFNTEDLKRLYRYSHAVFFKFTKQFKSFSIKNKCEPNITLQSFDELLPGRDPELDRVCNHVLHGTPLLRFPEQSDLQKSDAEEEAFYAEELQRLQAQRTHWKAGLANVVAVHEHVPVAVVRVSTSPQEASIDWAAHSRHKNLAFHDCWIDQNSGVHQALGQVIEQLKITPQKLVLIAPKSAQYDEAFISSIVDCICTEQKAGKACLGGSYGTWLAREGRIENTIFTQGVPAGTFEEAIALMPQLQDPLLLLSFGIYDREYLLQILEQAKLFPISRLSAEHVFKALRTEQIQRSPRPMMILNRDKIVIAQARENNDETALVIIQEAINSVKSGDHRRALELFEVAIPLKSDLPVLHYGKAIACLHLGKLQDAKSSLQTLLSMDPEHKEGKQLFSELAHIE